jgi:hypothetical protein
VTVPGNPVRKNVIDVISLLPSETEIYFGIYLIFVALAALYTVSVPAASLFFAESRPAAGVIFVAAQSALFTVFILLSLRHRRRPPQDTMLVIRLRRFAKKMPLPILRKLLGLAMSRLAPPAFEPYPDRTGATAFGDFFRSLWREVADAGSPEPELWWAYQDGRPEARVAGTRQRPIVAMAAGLIRRYPGDSDLVRVYLLHEFGHLANRDLSLFSWTTALNTGCQALIISTALSSTLYAFRFMSQDITSALLLMVGILWLGTLALTSLYLLRFAGILISFRELQADIWAVSRLSDFELFEKVVSAASSSPRARKGSRLSSLFGLRLRHLSAAERLDLLRRPLRLLAPRLRYFLLTAVLLVLLQSNPFGEAVGRNWMRLPFLLVWAPLAVAYFVAAYRSMLGYGLLRRTATASSIVSLSAGAAVILLLPFFKIPGLFPDILLSLGDWKGFALSARDSLITLKAQWCHLGFLAAPAASLCWVLAARIWSRRALDRANPSSANDFIGALYRKSAGAAICATAIQVIALSLLFYDSDKLTFIDAVQAPLFRIRFYIPCVPALFLLASLPFIFAVNRVRNHAKDE